MLKITTEYVLNKDANLVRKWKLEFGNGTYSTFDSAEAALSVLMDYTSVPGHPEQSFVLSGEQFKQYVDLMREWKELEKLKKM